MDLRTEVLAFDPELPIGQGSTPPVSWYIEPAFDQLERSAVFRRTWQFVCRTDQVAEPGSFVAGRTFGLSWLVVRGDDGQLRAMANVCRHKAAELCEGEGTVEHITCPYHGWTYRLDGSLRTAPQAAGIENLVREEMALPPLGVQVIGPLVFIHADPDADPLAPELDPLIAVLQASGWDRLTWHSRTTYTVDCNWKVFADNYLDGGYHIAHMHPTLAAQLDLPSYRTQVHGRYSVQTCDPARSDDPSLGVPPSQRIDQGAIYAWIYPNLMLNRYGPCLDTNVVWPISEHRCAVAFDFWFDPDQLGADAEHWAARSVQQADVTQQEDISVSERVQRGMESRTWARGRYAPNLEIGIHHFHTLLAADLRAALEPPTT